MTNRLRIRPSGRRRRATPVYSVGRRSYFSEARVECRVPLSSTPVRTG